MVEMVPLRVGAHQVIGITVDLPRTRLVVAAVPAGYIMCGALDVALLNTRLRSRRVVAGRALGVRTLADLLAKPLESVTEAAAELGLEPGMTGEQALEILATAQVPDPQLG